MLDIEKLLREGKTYNEIERMVAAQMHEAQKKIDKEKEAEAAAKQFEEKRKVAREKAVAALKEYFALECSETTKEEDLDMYVKVTIDTLRETIHQLGNIKMSRDGNHWEINFGNLFDALMR